MNDFEPITNYSKGKTDKAFSKNSYFSNASDTVDLVKKINKRKKGRK